MPSGSVQSEPYLLKVSTQRTLFLAVLGGALEFYDFVIFVFFTNVIGNLFFSATLPDWMRQVETFGIFAAGYLARPLGGVVMAHFGDTRGRKRMFTLSVLLMAVPTLLIGLLPTYESIGVAAPLLLLLLRVLQGVAIGGEAPGGWVFVAEHAAPGRDGFAVGLLTSGLSSGILLGSLVATGLNLLFSPGQIVEGYWRVPFLLGGILGLIAMLLRRWLRETPVFEEMQKRASISKALPLQTILKNHAGEIGTSILTTWMLTAAIVVVILMTPSLLQKLFGVPPTVAQPANLAGTAALCLSTALTGFAVDRFGIRRVAVPALLLLIAAVYGLYWAAAVQPALLLPLYVLAGMGCGGVVLSPILMVRSFPPAVRFSGVSFSYNLAYAVFGGLTPLWIAWSAQLNRLSPAHYVAAVTFVGLFATIRIGPESLKRSSSFNELPENNPA